MSRQQDLKNAKERARKLRRLEDAKNKEAKNEEYGSTTWKSL